MSRKPGRWSNAQNRSYRTRACPWTACEKSLGIEAVAHKLMPRRPLYLSVGPWSIIFLLDSQMKTGATCANCYRSLEYLTRLVYVSGISMLRATPVVCWIHVCTYLRSFRKVPNYTLHPQPYLLRYWLLCFLTCRCPPQPPPQKLRYKSHPA